MESPKNIYLSWSESRPILVWDWMLSPRTRIWRNNAGSRFIKLKCLLITVLVSFPTFAEVNSWECRKFEGATIIASDSTSLGKLGPKWESDSIFNDSSEHSTTWSSNSIFNSSNDYGNSYSSDSVFNESASNPPRIISEEGEEIGKLSVGPSWDRERYDPNDIKYTCDWD